MEETSSSFHNRFHHQQQLQEKDNTDTVGTSTGIATPTSTSFHLPLHLALTTPVPTRRDRETNTDQHQHQHQHQHQQRYKRDKNITRPQHDQDSNAISRQPPPRSFSCMVPSSIGFSSMTSSSFTTTTAAATLDLDPTMKRRITISHLYYSPQRQPPLSSSSGKTHHNTVSNTNNQQGNDTITINDHESPTVTVPSDELQSNKSSQFIYNNNHSNNSSSGGSSSHDDETSNNSISNSKNNNNNINNNNTKDESEVRDRDGDTRMTNSYAISNPSRKISTRDKYSNSTGYRSAKDNEHQSENQNDMKAHVRHDLQEIRKSMIAATAEKQQQQHHYTRSKGTPQYSPTAATAPTSDYELPLRISSADSQNDHKCFPKMSRVVSNVKNRHQSCRNKLSRISSSNTTSTDASDTYVGAFRVSANGGVVYNTSSASSYNDSNDDNDDNNDDIDDDDDSDGKGSSSGAVGVARSGIELVRKRLRLKEDYARSWFKGMSVSSSRPLSRHSSCHEGILPTRNHRREKKMAYSDEVSTPFVEAHQSPELRNRISIEQLETSKTNKYNCGISENCSDMSSDRGSNRQLVERSSTMSTAALAKEKFATWVDPFESTEWNRLSDETTTSVQDRGALGSTDADLSVYDDTIRLTGSRNQSGVYMPRFPSTRVTRPIIPGPLNAAVQYIETMPDDNNVIGPNKTDYQTFNNIRSLVVAMIILSAIVGLVMGFTIHRDVQGKKYDLQNTFTIQNFDEVLSVCASDDPSQETILSRIPDNVVELYEHYFEELTTEFEVDVTIDEPISECSPQILGILSLAFLFEPLDDIFQRYVLSVFYFSTAGDFWFDSSEWMTSSDICSWFGVECTSSVLSPDGETKSATAAENKIRKLHLPENNLDGSLANELFQVTSLREITLTSNLKLRGTISTRIRDSLMELETINLLRTSVEGTIPKELQYLHNLTSLLIASEEIVGTFPSFLGSNMTNLERLELSSNRIEGHMDWVNPVNLSKLKEIRVGGNFEGSFPESLWSLPSLRSLWFHNTGSINLAEIPPEAFAATQNPSRWEMISIQRGLYGLIPTEIGLLTNLKEFNLPQNELSGTLPTEVGKMTHLESLVLNGNRLNGKVPRELAMLKKLSTAWFTSNDFSGTLHTEFGLMTHLTRLALDSCRFVGTIPSEFVNLVNLEMLRLDSQINGNKDFFDCGSANLIDGIVPPKMCEGANSLKIVLSCGSNVFASCPPGCCTCDAC